jgi:hypothetical protein
MVQLLFFGIVAWDRVTDVAVVEIDPPLQVVEGSGDAAIVRLGGKLSVR